MLQYTPLMFADGRQTEISLGTGLKVPIGHSTAEFIGIASEDMQPGTGSWDSLSWIYVSHLLLQIPGFEVFAGASVRFNGTNEREYKVGNEIISLLGVRWNSKRFISYSMYGRYRWAASDLRFSGKVPNTGLALSGSWDFTSTLIPYDRETDSNWSQMLNMSVNGPRIGEEAKLIHVVETTWETWKTLYPDSFILSLDTGFSRNYDIYPYGSYKTNDNLLFPVSNEDSRLSKKRRVLGLIVGDRTKVFPISEFRSEIQVINENFNGTDVVVFGNAALNLAVSFLRTLSDGTVLTFTAVDGELPVIIEDNEGNKWDIFGNAVSGLRAGERLIPAESFISYWFAWAAFYPNAVIYNHPSSFLLQTSSYRPVDNAINRIHSPNLERRKFSRKELKRRLRKEWPVLVKTTKVLSVRRDGKMIGFQISHLPIHSVLSDFGIIQGDIILTVNGVDLKGLKSLFNLLGFLPEMDHVEIGIERENQTLKLVLNLD